MHQIVLELGFAVLLMAIAARIAGRFRLSVVPLLILIGLAVGPHLPHYGALDLRFTNSADTIHIMGRIGVLFLLFSLGLEFSLGRLISAGRSVAVAGTIYISINLTLGIFYGLVIGWPWMEVLVLAGITTISSSAIVAKMLTDLRRTARPETPLIVGIIMFEDIFLAGYLSVVSGLVLGIGNSVTETIVSTSIIAVVLLAFLTMGRFISRYLDRLFNIQAQETFLLMVFGVMFVVAGLSEQIGVAEAIGALLIGLVMAETGHARRIQQLSSPFRDFFGAIFFFSFGLSIDPLRLGDAVWLALGAVGITIIGNFAAGVIVGRISGLSGQGGVNIGLTIISRGEFSIVMANVAMAGGLLAVIQPFTAVYVLALSILGPLLTRESPRIFAWVNSAGGALRLWPRSTVPPTGGDD